MRKIFGVVIVLTVLVVAGCTMSNMSINSTDDEVKIAASNADEGGGNGHIKIPNGSALQVNAKITAGKLIIRIANVEHAFDKSGEFFIDVPAGDCDMFFSAANGLTGEITLRALPKV